LGRASVKATIGHGNLRPLTGESIDLSLSFIGSVNPMLRPVDVSFIGMFPTPPAKLDRETVES
jgi:hypothetical protein